jgi:hypothetical protein
MALGAAVVALAGTGCSALPWSDHSPQLYSPVNGRFGASQVGLTPGSTLTEGSIPVCVDEPGTVTITRVVPIDPVNAITVIAYAVRSIPANSSPLGASPGDLTAIGLSGAQQRIHSVSKVCDAQERATVGLDGAPDPGTPDPRIDLVVTFTAPRLPARATGLRLDYTVAGQNGSATAAFDVAMCAGTIGDTCP